MAENEIKVKISGDSAQLVSELAKAKASVQSTGNGMQAALGRIKGGFEDSMKAMLGFRGALVAIAGATGFAAFVKRSIDSADELSKMAQKVGVSTESLSTLKYAADLADVGLESLQTGLKYLSKNAADAANGTGDAKDAFRAMGIELKGGDGQIRNTEELLLELADKFKSLPDGAEKTAAAMKVFGRSGADLIPLLNEGAAGIKELQERARELGLELSTEAGKAAEEFNDRLTDLKAEAEGLGRSIAVKMLPGLNEFVQVVWRAYEDSGLLMAALVALGGVGDAVFTSSLETRIKKLKEAIEFPATDSFTGLTEDVEALRKELARLEALKAQIDADNKKRSEDRRRIEEEEKKQREKNAAALRKKMEGQRNAGKQAEEMAKIQEKAIAREGELLEETDKINEEYFDNLKKEIKSFHDDTRTPLEKFEAKIKRLNELFEQGMDEDLYFRSIAKAAEDMEKEVEKTTEKTETAFEELKETIEGWGRESAAAIADFAVDGKMSFSDLINSMIKDMMKMIVYQNIMKPLFSSISTGASSLLSSMFNSPYSNLDPGYAIAPTGATGYGGTAGGYAHGGVFSRGNVIPFSRGGVVARPTVFPMARGMGLMGEAGPEAVMPLTRLPGGDLGVSARGAGVVVNVINNAGAEISTQKRETPQGVEIDVLIDQAVAKKLSQRGSYSNKSLRNDYGAKERLTGR